MSKLNLSYWEKQSFFKDLDVIVIGSGIVGLSAALQLKKMDASLRVLVAERGALPIGASTRNAGFACFGSLSELLDDLQQHSESEVFELLEKRWHGLQRLKERVGIKALDYKEWGGYEIFKPKEKDNFERCRERLPYFNEQLERLIGQKEVYQIVDDQIDRFGFAGVDHLICNRSEGQIDTGKMMARLLELARNAGIEIINGLMIDQIEDASDQVHLQTNQGWTISSQKILIATNGFATQLLPDLDLRAARNQVLITKEIPQLPFKGCFHYDSGYFYFRNINQRILLGGGRNLALDVEQTSEFGTTELIRAALHRLLSEVVLPNQKVEIDHFWSGILGVGQHKKPIVRKISNRVFAAVRMGGMGVAIGSLVGEEGAKLLFDS